MRRRKKKIEKFGNIRRDILCSVTLKVHLFIRFGICPASHLFAFMWILAPGNTALPFLMKCMPNFPPTKSRIETDLHTFKQNNRKSPCNQNKSYTLLSLSEPIYVYLYVCNDSDYQLFVICSTFLCVCLLLYFLFSHFFSVLRSRCWSLVILTHFLSSWISIGHYFVVYSYATATALDKWNRLIQYTLSRKQTNTSYSICHSDDYLFVIWIINWWFVVFSSGKKRPVSLDVSMWCVSFEFDKTGRRASKYVWGRQCNWCISTGKQSVITYARIHQQLFSRLQHIFTRCLVGGGGYRGVYAQHSYTCTTNAS